MTGWHELQNIIDRGSPEELTAWRMNAAMARQKKRAALIEASLAPYETHSTSDVVRDLGKNVREGRLVRDVVAEVTAKAERLESSDPPPAVAHEIVLLGVRSPEPSTKEEKKELKLKLEKQTGAWFSLQWRIATPEERAIMAKEKSRIAREKAGITKKLARLRTAKPEIIPNPNGTLAERLAAARLNDPPAPDQIDHSSDDARPRKRAKVKTAIMAMGEDNSEAAANPYNDPTRRILTESKWKPPQNEGRLRKVGTSVSRWRSDATWRIRDDWLDIKNMIRNIHKKSPQEPTA